MKNTIVLFFVFAVILLNSHALGQDKNEILEAGSIWTNQSGSTLCIQGVDPNGMLSGYYINREQGYGCQNTQYPLTGWIFGTAITFTVIWDNSTESCNSITSWTGFYYNGVITTLWQLVVNGSTSVNQIAQGKDIFSPGTQKENKSLILMK
jgi:hypothetical protein